MALTEAFKQAIWLKELAGNISLLQKYVMCDSQSDICLAKNQVFHSKTKRLEVRYTVFAIGLMMEKLQVKQINIDKNASNFSHKLSYQGEL